MTITASSPVKFSFARIGGGSDMRSEIQLWSKPVAPGSRPVAVLRFEQPTQATETVDRSLAPGTYVGVHLVLVREALNGRFKYSLSVAGHHVDAREGDVNTTPAPNDIRTFKSEFDLTVN